MKFMSFFSRFGKEWRRGKPRGRRLARPHAASARLDLETLETRVVPTVLPPAVVNFQSTFGTGVSPQVAVDPVNPLKVAAVASNNSNGYTLLASFDGGFTYTTVIAPPTLPGTLNIPDPHVPPTFPGYTNNTDATLAIDRNEQVYVLMREHDATNTSGAVVLQKFNFNVATPAAITHPIANEVLYQWVGHDAVYNPAIAVDNNVPVYADPSTGTIQTDTMVGKGIYVAWNTVNQSPAIDTRIPGNNTLDMNGINTAAFNPNTIKVLASADGGVTFSTQQFANNDANYGAVGTTNLYSNPQIVFTQGRADGTVPGGVMALLWNSNLRRNSDGTILSGGFVVDRTQPDFGVASLPAVAATQVTWPGGPLLVTDAIFGGTDPNGNQLPDVAQTTDVPLTVNITDPNFDKLADLTTTVSLFHPHLNHVRVVLIAPNNQQVVLVNNYTNSLGNNANTPGGIRITGLADQPNLGIDTASTTTWSTAQVVGTTFDQQAAMPINDLGSTQPFIGHYRPDDQGTGSGLDSGGLEMFRGLTRDQLNGTWHLQITDFRNDRLGPTGMGQNSNQFLVGWSLNFTAHISTSHFGTDGTVTGLTSVPSATTPNRVVGAPNDVYLQKPAASPTVGVGPAFSVAVDNTLGSFSPYQGRIYVAATMPGLNSTRADDFDILLAFSDDAGATWKSTNPATGQTLRVNDDTSTDNSEGTRPQFMPKLAVDPATGTLAVTYFDARNDAARARVTTSLQTSIDGGMTWSQTVYLNVPQVATDAITGKPVTVGPIPTNIAAAGGLGVGDRQGLAVYGGKVYAFWSGNLNSAATVFSTADATIAAGPRVVSSDQGPVIADGVTGTYNNTFTSDGTRQLDGFTVQFDRRIDPATVNASNVHLVFRDPVTPASQPGIDLSNQVTSFTPLDTNTAPNPPAVSIGNATVLEGTGFPAFFPVILSMPQTSPVTLTVTAGDVTARAGVNYRTPAGTVTIPAGQTTAFVTVTILPDTDADTLADPNETFVVNLSAPPGGVVLARSQAVGTIIDSAAPRNVSVGDGIRLEKSTPGVDFPVILNQPYFQDVTVHYQTADGTAVAGRDYAASTGTVTIPAGRVQADVIVPLLGNTVENSNRTFTLTIDSPPVGIPITRNQATGIIVAKDVLLPLTVNVGDGLAVKPSGGVTNMLFPVVLSIPQTTAIIAQFQTFDLPPGPGFAHSTGPNPDYVPTSGSVTFLAGQTTATITVQVIGDTLPEGNEIFLLNLTGASGGISLGRTAAIGTIVDSSGPPAVAIGNATVQELENGSTPMYFPVFLSKPSAQPVTVSYTTGDITARAGVDYLATSGILTIPAGQTSATITVAVLGDQLVETNELFAVSVTGSTGASIAKGQALGTIVDSPLGVSIGDTSIREGDSGTQNMLFTVYFNGVTGDTVTVDYRTADIPNIPNPARAGIDYLATSGTLTFQPGQTVGTITVPVIGNFIPEPNNKLFFVNLTGATNANLIRAQAVGTIVDDDTVPALTVGDVLVKEGDPGDTVNALVPIYLSHPLPAGQEIDVNFHTADGTAVSPADYVGTSGTLMIPGGTTSTTVTIPIVTSLHQEPNLTFTVNLDQVTSLRPGSTVPNAVIAGSPGTVTIANDDVSISVTDANVSEPANGTTTVTFRVFLSGVKDRTVTANWTTADGTAVAGQDYTATGGTLTFTPGQTQKIVTVTVLHDTTTTSDETFFINLSNVVGADPSPTTSRLQGTGIIF
jgi:hypothetical protein